jgi:hypothetical protein
VADYDQILEQDLDCVSTYMDAMEKECEERHELPQTSGVESHEIFDATNPSHKGRDKRLLHSGERRTRKPKQTRTAKQVQFHITTYPSPLPHITTSPLLHLHSLTLTGNLENSPS